MSLPSATPRCRRCRGPMNRCRDLDVWTCPAEACVTALHAWLAAEEYRGASPS